MKPSKETRELYEAAVDDLVAQRKAKGLSIRQVAEALDMDRENYGRFEKKAHMPTIETLRQVAAFHGIPLWSLFLNAETAVEMKAKVSADAAETPLSKAL